MNAKSIMLQPEAFVPETTSKISNRLVFIWIFRPKKGNCGGFLHFI